MATPSFDELLSEARRISAAKTQAAGFPRGELIAKSVSNFVNTILNTQGKEHQTFVGSVDPNTGEVSPYAQPQTSGRSLMERMMGVQGMDESQTGIPLTREDARAFALAQAQKREVVPKPPSFEEGLIGEEVAKKVRSEGIPATKDWTFGQLKIFKPQFLMTPEGGMVASSIFGEFKNLPNPPGGGAGTKGKQPSASQADAFLGAIRALQGLEDMEKLAETGSLGTGPGQVKYTNAPGSDRYISAFGTNEQRQFKKALREYQSNYLKTQTGSQRGMTEVAFLIPATIDPNLKQDKLIADIKNSKDKVRQQLELYVNFFKTRGLEYTGFMEQYPEAFEQGKEKSSEFEQDVLNYSKKYNITPQEAQQIKLKRTSGK